MDPVRKRVIVEAFDASSNGQREFRELSPSEQDRILGFGDRLLDDLGRMPTLTTLPMLAPSNGTPS
jgi:hypothetical protein